MRPAPRPAALLAAARVADRYIYNSVAPQVVALTPVDTGALAASLASPDAPGAIHSGVMAGDRFYIKYGTEMDSWIRYDNYGPTSTGGGRGNAPYYYPGDVENTHHMMQEGKRYFREVLHGSALGNIAKAIMRVMQKGA